MPCHLGIEGWVAFDRPDKHTINASQSTVEANNYSKYAGWHINDSVKPESHSVGPAPTFCSSMNHQSSTEKH